MLFSQSIPDNILENATTAKFVDVLDRLQEEKQEILSSAIRAFNHILCMDEKWLRKYLTDYGFGDIPKGFPIKALQQMLLNANTIMQLRGSKLGIELFCSVCSLGEVEVNFYRNETLKVIHLDSLKYGYIKDNTLSETLYLIDNNEFIDINRVSIVIKSKYFDGTFPKEKEAILGYINKNLSTYISFYDYLLLSIKDQPNDDFYYHGLLYRKFIN